MDAVSNERDPAYFGYYGQLAHQQNMMADYVRTSTYYSAIKGNANAFVDKLVLDVGAGSGILSFFAVLGGAIQVFAVEASIMAKKMRRLIQNGVENEFKMRLRERVTVVEARIEDPAVNIPKVDTIISEPIGVFLLHERMLESFIISRDRFLKPGGTVFPTTGVIFVAPCCDAIAWNDTLTKAKFWEQTDFFNIDLTGLAKDAITEHFSMPLVGPVDPKTLLSFPSAGYTVDFRTVTTDQLLDLVIPIQWVIHYTGLIHGIVGWFDISFFTNDPKGTHLTLTTSPFRAATHWQQIRFLFSEPLAANAGETVRGWLRCRANVFRSYAIVGEVVVNGEPSDPKDVTNILDTLASHERSTFDDSWFSNRSTNASQYAEASDSPSHVAMIENGAIRGGYGRRRGWWNLDEQAYYYSQNVAPVQPHAQQFSGLTNNVDSVAPTSGNAPESHPKYPEADGSQSLVGVDGDFGTDDQGLFQPAEV